MKIIEALENKIQQLKDWEWEAKEARDYPACLHLYGAVIHFTQFLKELKEDEIRNNSDKS